MEHNDSQPQPPPNERTSLLRSTSTVNVTAIQNGPYFCDTPITPCVEQLKSSLAETIRRGQDTLSPLYPHFPTELQDSNVEIGHFLICLLSLRQSELKERDEHASGATSNSRGIEILDKTIADLWKDEVLSDRRDAQFMEGVLWTVFPVSRGSGTRRVIDCLHGTNAPEILVLSAELLRSVSRVWAGGFLPDGPPGAEPRNGAASLVRRCSSYCTPRAAYSAHLLADLLFVALLANYLVDPPALHAYSSLQTAREIIRDTYIILYSFSAMLLPSAGSTTSFALVLFSFLLGYPELPIPGYTSFSLLLLSFFFRLLDYHRAHTPSSVFLFRANHILPLVHILGFHINNTLIPLMLFLFPVSFFVFALLAYSNAFDLDTRLVFALALVMICCVFFFLLLSFAPSSNAQLANIHTAHPTDAHDSAWDRYSQHIGLEARKSFIRCVAVYGTWHLFPPPFNVLQLLFVDVPRAGLSVVRRQHGHVMDRVEQILWGVSAGPMVVTLGVLWSWVSPVPRSGERDRVGSDEES